MEPALASRPGRIDEAIEIALPDAECRSRLLDLYGRGLALELSNRPGIIERTQGVSAAFLKELLRKSALLAADSSPSEGELRVTDEYVDQALFELVTEGGELTKALLGVAGPEARRPSCS